MVVPSDLVCIRLLHPHIQKQVKVITERGNVAFTSTTELHKICNSKTKMDEFNAKCVEALSG